MNTNLWVSAAGFESPYYRFYTDSDGSQELTEVIFDTSKSYTFYRLNEETSHPFFISDSGYKQTSSDAILITGDGSPTNGITGNQSFKVEFAKSAGDIEELLYYCSSHQLMQGDITLDHKVNLLSTPSKPDLVPASDAGSSVSANYTNTNTPTFTGTAKVGNTIEVLSDNNSLGFTKTDALGNWSFTVSNTTALPDGTYAITAIATDTANLKASLQTTPVTMSSLGRTAQEFSNEFAFAVVKDDGSVITWGDSDAGGNSSKVASDLQSGVSQIFSTSSAFAALKDDGSVITWGNSDLGGDSSGVALQLKSDISQIFSTYKAFAALKDDGSVITWGNSDQGGDSSSVTLKLQSGVSQIFSSVGAFAALKDDGSVVTWGIPRYGGESGSASSQLSSGVNQVFTADSAFAALKEDGSVITWGDSYYGGDSSNVSSQLMSGVSRIVSTGGAFAALKDDGSVITWGDSDGGGNSSNVASDLQSGVSQIFSTSSAFAALKDDGSVITWGNSDLGGNSGSVAMQLQSGVSQIFSTYGAFAALKDDGSVITWGGSFFGGDSLVVALQLQSGVAQIFANMFSFSALNEEGAVITWGYGSSGGNSNNVSSQLQSGVSQIFSTYEAFAALKEDGSVITWGDSRRGGDSSSVASQLRSGVVSFADPFQDDRLVFESTSSDPSPPLNLTIDTVAPVFTSSNTAGTIDENSGSNQIVYTATAEDNSSVSFRLKPNKKEDVSFFAINTQTGQVKLIDNPDFETKPSYTFTVIAADYAGNQSKQRVSFSIRDINELPDKSIIHSITDVKTKSKISTFILNDHIKIRGNNLDMVIVGTKRKDNISGTSEGEALAGMKGKDVLRGGGGADGFLFSQSGGFGNKHADQIKDFNSKEGDSILLDQDVFGLSKKIKLKSYSSKNKVKKAAKSKNDFVYDEKKGLLYFNENGKDKGWGDGGLFAKLHGAPELGAEDFTIV